MINRRPIIITIEEIFKLFAFCNYLSMNISILRLIMLTSLIIKTDSPDHLILILIIKLVLWQKLILTTVYILFLPIPFAIHPISAQITNFSCQSKRANLISKFFITQLFVSFFSPRRYKNRCFFVSKDIFPSNLII